MPYDSSWSAGLAEVRRRIFLRIRLCRAGYSVLYNQCNYFCQVVVDVLVHNDSFLFGDQWSIDLYRSHPSQPRDLLHPHVGASTYQGNLPLCRCRDSRDTARLNRVQQKRKRKKKKAVRRGSLTGFSVLASGTDRKVASNADGAALGMIITISLGGSAISPYNSQWSSVSVLET